MSNINIDLLIQDNSWKSEKDINKKLMEDIFKLVLNYLKITIQTENIIEISVTLTNDSAIKKLNKIYRNKNKQTNVLTFSLYEKNKHILKDLQQLPCMSLGDIVFSLSTIQKEAKEQNKLLLNHFIHMLVHSYLHLFAYDHISTKKRKDMENIEISILQTLNIDNPYL